MSADWLSLLYFFEQLAPKSNVNMEISVTHGWLVVLSAVAVAAELVCVIWPKSRFEADSRLRLALVSLLSSMFNISEETLAKKTKFPLWDAALRVVLRLWLCFSPIIRYIFDFSLRSAPHMSVKLKLCANTWRMRRKAYDAALSCLAKAEGLESTMICMSVKEKQIMELYSKSCFYHKNCRLPTSES